MRLEMIDTAFVLKMITRIDPDAWNAMQQCGKKEFDLPTGSPAATNGVYSTNIENAKWMCDEPTKPQLLIRPSGL